MKRALGTIGLVLCLVGSAAADVTITSKTGGSGMAAMAAGTSVVSIKGMTMRSEQSGGPGASAFILDADSRSMTILDSKKKRAEVFDLSEIARDQTAVRPEDLTVDLEERDGTREIAGYSCREHHLRVVVSMAIMDGSQLKTVIEGPVYIAADVPGHEEVVAFYRAVAERGLFFMPPAAAQAQPGQAKSFAEMYRAMAEKGLALASELEMRFEGEGMMATIMSKMNMSMTSEVTSIDTGTLSASLFEVPPGYKAKKR